MRTAARTDSNQQDVVKALRSAGMTAAITSALGAGFPDLVVGYRGINIMLELKDGDKVPSKQALTIAEQEFHATWGGQIAVVSSAEEAVMAVIEHAKDRGRL